MFTVELPSGASVSFRPPSFIDRRKAIRNFPGAKECGYIPEDLLAAMCITQINGQPTPQEWEHVDPISFFEPWELKDQAYYLEVFMNMFYLDDKEKQTAQDIAKKLMGGSSQPPATTGNIRAPKASSVKVVE